MTGLTRQRRRTPAMTPWFRTGPLNSLQREMDDLLTQFAAEVDGGEAQLLPTPIDVRETENSLEIKMDVPGVEPDDIDIQVNGDNLIITGERKSEEEKEGETYYRIERSSGRFSRSIPLPFAVDEENIDAEYGGGVLRLSLPKVEESKPRRVKVKSA